MGIKSHPLKLISVRRPGMKEQLTAWGLASLLAMAGAGPVLAQASEKVAADWRN